MNNNDFQDKEYRDAFVDAMIRTGIAFQIKALRKREEMSQTELGESVNTPQNVISRYENPDYDAFTLKTLRRLASAFDVALIVKFATFGELRKLTKDRSPEKLAIESFSDEQESLNQLSTADSVVTDVNIQIGETDFSIQKNVTSMVTYEKTHNRNDPIDTQFTDQNEYSYANC